MKNIWLYLRLQFFSFSNCNINPNPTHLPKHQTLRPIHQFSQRILLYNICRMLLCAWAYGLKSEISLDTGDSASNAVVKRSVVINQRCAECVCLYTMDFASAGKNILLLYVTVCEKVAPRLNKHDDVIEWKFVKIEPPKWRAGCAPDKSPSTSTSLSHFYRGDADLSASMSLLCAYTIHSAVNAHTFPVIT